MPTLLVPWAWCSTVRASAWGRVHSATLPSSRTASSTSCSSRKRASSRCRAPTTCWKTCKIESGNSKGRLPRGSRPFCCWVQALKQVVFQRHQGFGAALHLGKVGVGVGQDALKEDAANGEFRGKERIGRAGV